MAGVQENRSGEELAASRHRYGNRAGPMVRIVFAWDGCAWRGARTWSCAALLMATAAATSFAGPAASQPTGSGEARPLMVPSDKDLAAGMRAAAAARGVKGAAIGWTPDEATRILAATEPQRRLATPVANVAPQQARAPSTAELEAAQASMPPTRPASIEVLDASQMRSVLEASLPNGGQ